MSLQQVSGAAPSLPTVSGRQYEPVVPTGTQRKFAAQSLEVQQVLVHCVGNAPPSSALVAQKSPVEQAPFTQAMIPESAGGVELSAAPSLPASTPASRPGVASSSSSSSSSSPKGLSAVASGISPLQVPVRVLHVSPEGQSSFVWQATATSHCRLVVLHTMPLGQASAPVVHW